MTKDGDKRSQDRAKIGSIGRNWANIMAKSFLRTHPRELGGRASPPSRPRETPGELEILGG
eukprot:312559-Karenia_brevis.AAC.1